MAFVRITLNILTHSCPYATTYATKKHLVSPWILVFFSLAEKASVLLSLVRNSFLWCSLFFNSLWYKLTLSYDHITLLFLRYHQGCFFLKNVKVHVHKVLIIRQMLFNNVAVEKPIEFASKATNSVSCFIFTF